MEKNATINMCVRILTAILIAVGVFVAVPMITLAVEIILGKITDPELIELPMSFKRLGLVDLQANRPGVLTTYVVSLFFTLLAAVYLLVGKQMHKIERIASWCVFVVALFVLAPSVRTIIKEAKHALEIKKEQNRDTYMGIKMNDVSRQYLSKNGWTLTKHEYCDNGYANKGEYLNGDPQVAYLDAWNPHGQEVYQAEKYQPVEPGTYRIICSARAEGAGCYVFATTKSGKNGVKLVEIPHYGNTEGEIWENALDGSAEKEANMGNGFGWSKVVVTIQVGDNDTLVYGVSTDSKFTGKPVRSKWFSAADFEVERLGIN